VNDQNVFVANATSNNPNTWHNLEYFSIRSIHDLQRISLNKNYQEKLFSHYDNLLLSFSEFTKKDSV